MLVDKSGKSRGSLKKVRSQDYKTVSKYWFASQGPRDKLSEDQNNFSHHVLVMILNWIKFNSLSIQDKQMKVHVDNCCFMTSLPSSVGFRQHFTSESKIRTWSTPKYITPCLISEFEYTSNAFDIRVNSFSSKIRFLTSMLYINTTNQVLST